MAEADRTRLDTLLPSTFGTAALLGKKPAGNPTIRRASHTELKKFVKNGRCTPAAFERLNEFNGPHRASSLCAVAALLGIWVRTRVELCLIRSIALADYAFAIWEQRMIGQAGLAFNNFIVVAVIVTTLYFAREILVPIALAVLLSFVLAPLVKLFQRVRVPRPVAVVLAVVAALAVAISLGTMVMV